MRRHVAGLTLRSLSVGSWTVEGTPYAIMASDRARKDGQGQLKSQFWWEAVDTSQGNLIIEGTCAATLSGAARLLAKTDGLN